MDTSPELQDPGNSDNSDNERDMSQVPGTSFTSETQYGLRKERAKLATMLLTNSERYDAALSAIMRETESGTDERLERLMALQSMMKQETLHTDALAASLKENPDAELQDGDDEASSSDPISPPKKKFKKEEDGNASGK